MAFNFGISSSSAPNPFGANTSSLFGAASTPSLFNNTTLLSGAASTPSLFGSSFGQQSTSSLFGGSSTPAYGSAQPAKVGGPLFGNTTPSLFGGTSVNFGQSQGAFGFGQQPGSTFGSFGQPNQQAIAPQGGLATTDNKQLTHYTKWEEINSQGQQQLLELEKMISQTREESRQLSQLPRLQSVSIEEPGTSEAALRQTLQGFASSRKSDEEAVLALNEKVHELLRDTEVATRTFTRSYKWREAAKANSGQTLPVAGIRDLLNAPVILPSHFLRRSVEGFQATVAQYVAIVTELEKNLPANNRWTKSNLEKDDFLQQLPTTLHNLHDLLYHIAAKIQNLHENVEQCKEHYLGRLQQSGDLQNPFKEAERREQQHAKSQLNVISHLPYSADLNAPGGSIGRSNIFLPNSAQIGFGASPTPSPVGNQFGGSLFAQQGFQTEDNAAKTGKKTRARK